jgi:hypothetical protein
VNDIAHDKQPLDYPVGVLKDGMEISIPTIGRAFQYLHSELKEWNATPEWQSALDMIAVARAEYTPANIKTATGLFKEVCRMAGRLDPHTA